MPQGYNSINTHARISARNPQALGCCDVCGFPYNRNNLRWQYQWAGMQLQNLRQLVCPTCYDVPNEQLRTIIIPPDPLPIIDPRPEPYSTEVTGWIITETGSAWLTEDGSAIILQENLTPPQIGGDPGTDVSPLLAQVRAEQAALALLYPP